MVENETYYKLIGDIDKTIKNYIEIAKELNRKPTRNDVIEKISTRLQELIKINCDSKERVWILSGMAAGIVIVLRIDDKLKAIE